MARLTRYHGTGCPYCERMMDIGSIRLRPTRDHIVPRIKGGRKTVVCCGFCNSLKGHMMPDEWDAFRAAFAGYWKFSPRDRRIALAKHKGEYTPGRAPREKRHSKPALRHPPIIVPPELIYRDQQLRNYGKETVRAVDVGEGTEAAQEFEQVTVRACG